MERPHQQTESMQGKPGTWGYRSVGRQAWAQRLPSPRPLRDQRVFPCSVGPVWPSPGDSSYFSIPWRAGQHVVGEQPPGWAVGLTMVATLPLPNPSPGSPSRSHGSKEAKLPEWSPFSWAFICRHTL